MDSRWQAGSEDGFRSLATGSLIYTGTEGVISAYDYTGDQRWQTTFPGTSLIDVIQADDGVIAIGRDGQVLSLAPTGAERWQASVTGTVTGKPIVAHDQLYLTTESGRLFALRTATGELSWTLSLDVPSATRMMTLSTLRESLLIGTELNHLYLISEDGNVCWGDTLKNIEGYDRDPPPARTNGFSLPGAAASDSDIAVIPHDGLLLIIDVAEMTCREIGDPTDSDFLPWFSTPYIDGEVAFVSDDRGGRLTAFNINTLEYSFVWSPETDFDVCGIPSVQNGSVITPLRGEQTRGGIARLSFDGELIDKTELDKAIVELVTTDDYLVYRTGEEIGVLD